MLNHDGVLREWEDSEVAAVSFLLAHLMVSIGLLCIVLSIVSLYPFLFFHWSLE